MTQTLLAMENKEYYYIDTISMSAASSLAEVGYKAEIEDNSPDEYPGSDVHCLTMYAEVFSIFIRFGINIYIIKQKSGDAWHAMVVCDTEKKISLWGTWKEVAEIGIQYAVDFLKVKINGRKGTER